MPTHAQQVSNVLHEVFGSPSEPRVPDQLADLLDLSQLQQAAGRVASNRPGHTLGLYRRHCAVCHGLSGDGRGPAALYESPYPRDYRAGVFKFKSTYRGVPPTDADLAATLRFGLPGTAMPSFELLPPEEIGALVQYIKYLAIRGELERSLVRHVGEEFDFDPVTGEASDETRLDWSEEETRELLLDELLPRIARRWRDAPNSIVPVDESLAGADPPSAAEVEAGRQLFHDARRANCVKCHGQNGAGGVNVVDFSDWDKRTHEFIAQTDRLAASRETLTSRLAETAPARRGLLEKQLVELNAEISQRERFQDALLPPRVADPRRLAPGALRGVRSRADLFRIISQGVAGTPMPAVGATDPGGVGALTDEEIWRLVAYVQSLTGGIHD